MGVTISLDEKKWFTIKRRISMLICFLTLGGVLYGQTDANKKAERSLSLMTYNLKFASSTHKPLWKDRREMQVALIKKYDPDIIGTQEGLKEQIDYLAEQLPAYAVMGEGRKGGDDDEHMAIFCKRDKFRLRELNNFALSRTPKILGSGPRVNPRIATMARFAFINMPDNENGNNYTEDYRGHWEDNKEFYIFNTHFFNGSIDTLARENAAKHNLLKDCLNGGKGIDWILYKGNV
ncbi:hypothetical protein JM658_09155 [Joostella atrarenae]|uniref:Uncharacterized protein n=1 Tax=Joostella atrarenae TaxID=679257 RepID=A0ABS9J3I6_9FLAO|nr:hypothetical protein [Joostella atrarenae]MCF8714991.1 hypothetical protein [Joostella atrarenae]